MNTSADKKTLPIIECRQDLPVVLLADLNPRWPQQEIQERTTTTEILASSLIEVGHPVKSIYLEVDELPEALFHYKPEEVIVFNLCDEVPGIPRSCALVAQKLEKCGFTFTGADSRALILCQDKFQILHLMEDHGFDIPEWEKYTSIENITWDKYPAIVKPAFEHCSYGITRDSVVQSQIELIQRIQQVLEKFHQPALVQEFIDGREFHVGVIGNGRPFVLPPVEVDFSGFCDIRDRLCTYEAKFDKTSLAYRLTELMLPVDLSIDQLRFLDEMVTTVYLVTGCRDYARMDIRLKDNIFYILDVNHNADLAPETSMVLAAENIGLSYGQFGSLLINLAAHRHAVFRDFY